MRTTTLALTLLLITVTALGQLTDGTLTVPVAGSTHGALGSRFRTSLRLTGRGSGHIFFRPQGQFFGDERDPHIAYALAPYPHFTDGSVYFDDVVEAMGAAGVGSLDIVPDSIQVDANRSITFVPRVEARVYNETPSGRFGSLVPALEPTDAATESLSVPLHQETLATSRVNIGVRTFDKPLTMDVSLREADIFMRLKTIDLPANSFALLPVATILGIEPSCCDQEVFLGLRDSGAIAFYTITENTTGDPTVYLRNTIGEPRIIERIPSTDEATFVVAPGGSVRTASLTISFVSVTQDSRCPLGVLCIWQGVGEIRLLVEKPGGSQTLLLSTMSPTAKAFDKTLTLLELQPYPSQAGVVLDPREYRAKIALSR